MIQRSRFSFFSNAQIWYSRDPEQCPLSDQFENVIVLSDEFYREITAHPIPADLEAVKVLAGAPAVLDLFMWFRRTMGQVSRKYWATVSPEEKRMREQKGAQARWSKNHPCAKDRQI